MFLFALIITVVSASPYTIEDRCAEGPDYWCTNEKTALECGAVSFCSIERKLQPVQDNKTPDAAPVNVTLYFESLCPGCKAAIQNQIFPTYEKLASSGILNVKFVPYGNTQERFVNNDWVFYCQHGEAECLGNKIESCALHYYPDQSQYVPFMHCVEYYGVTLVNAKYCAGLSQMDYNTIETCTYNSQGTQLEHEMGLETSSLNPPHQFVPWFTLNGYHDYAIQEGLLSNMLVYVCSQYRGTKPAACNQRQEDEKCYKKN